MRYSFDIDDIRKQVLDFIIKLGIQPANEGDIILDGEIHRYMVHDDKRGNKNGAVCIHTDGWPAGWVQDWRDGGEKHYWKYNTSDFEEEHRLAEEARKKRRLDRSDDARRLWNKLAPSPEMKITLT